MNHITKKMTGPTKQSMLQLRGEMDCFAPLAMTAKHAFAISAPRHAATRIV